MIWLDFILYGFLLTATLGLLTSWLDRKITARLQYRVGPPLLQPFIDLVKLFGKETLVPAGASKMMFFSSPVVGLASVMIVATLVWVNNQNPQVGFLGDLIVVLYFLTMPSISLMMGGFASRNPLASLGASREMKLILSYELPFLLSVFVAVIKTGFVIRLGEILSFQAEHAAVASSLSGGLALVVAVLCMQAKLGIVPFDAAEAETEIISGVTVEYSGVGLALFRLMKSMLLCTLPIFLIVLFLGGLRFDGIQIFYSVCKYVGLILAITVIRNTNPRVRIDQAVRFFWGPVMVLAVVAVVLALNGF